MARRIHTGVQVISPAFCSPLLLPAGGVRCLASRCSRSGGFSALASASRSRRGLPHHARPGARRAGAAFSFATADFPVLQDHAVDVDGVVVKLMVEDLGGRRRRISGGIDIEASCDRVWHVLTQYELMDQWMPNITKSVLEERAGQMFLDQVGVISRKLSLKSRMLMRVSENPTESISFSRVEGRDFSEFEGRYILKSMDGSNTRLDYELVAIPMPLFPVALVERKIVKEVPAMLASARREALFGTVVSLT